MAPSGKWTGSPRILFLTGAGLMIILGVTVMIGWYSHDFSLVQIAPAWTPMQFNEALAFVLCGAAVLMILFENRRAAFVLGAAAALVGCLTFKEYLFRVSFGIDQLFLKPALVLKTAFPGRMAPSAAVCFTFAGAAFMLEAIQERMKQRSFVVGTLGAIIVLLGAGTLFGYLVDLESSFGWRTFARTAFHSAVGFLFLGGAVLALGWKDSHQEETVFPTWLSILIFLGTLTGSVCLWQALQANEEALIRRVIQSETERVQVDMREGLKARMLALVAMGHHEKRGYETSNEWEKDADFYRKQYPGIEAIAWVDPLMHVRRVVPFRGPVFGRYLQMGAEDYRSLTLKSGGQSHTVWISRSLSLEKREERGFLVFVPVGPKERMEGLIVGVLNAERLIESVMAPDFRARYELSFFDREEKIYGPPAGADPAEIKWGRDIPLDLYRAAWRLRVWPKREMIARLESFVPEMVLGGGLLMAFFVSVAVFLAHLAYLGRRELEKANEKLREEIHSRVAAQQDLARSNKELEEFAYVASHDLQEPLRKIASYTQLLQDRFHGQFDEKADKFIRYIIDGSRRMQKMVSDLLSYSRAGGANVAREDTDFETVVRDVVHYLEPVIQEAQAEITYEKLPKIKASPSQMAQLLQNLISNGVKFRGKEPCRIHLSAEWRSKDDGRGGNGGGEWEFTVRDNGIGIPAQDQPRIFGMFQRLQGRGEYPGSGMGLAICKKIVERHGGKIWVQAAPGAGSVFHFTLPGSRTEG